MITDNNVVDFKPDGYVGIDPGSEGAVAVWYGGRISEVIDMPRHDVMVSGSKRSMLDYRKLAEILIPFIQQRYLFTIEMTPVFVVGGGSSSSANWSLGYSQGFLTAHLLANRAAFRLVRPQEWHKLYNFRGIDLRSVENFKTPSEQAVERKRLIKAHSLKMATNIAPHVELRRDGKIFKSGKQCADKLFDGRCESILICNWGRLYGK